MNENTVNTAETTERDLTPEEMAEIIAAVNTDEEVAAQEQYVAQYEAAWALYGQAVKEYRRARAHYRLNAGEEYRKIMRMDNPDIPIVHPCTVEDRQRGEEMELADPEVKKAYDAMRAAEAACPGIDPLPSAPAAPTAPAPAGNTGGQVPSLEEAIAAALDRYFERHRVTLPELLDRNTAWRISGEMMVQIRLRIEAENSQLMADDRKVGNKGYPVPTKLPAAAAVRAILETGDVALLKMKGNKRGIPIVKRYDENGFSGIWEMITDRKDESTALRAVVYNLLGTGAPRNDVENVISSLYAIFGNPKTAGKYVRRDGWRHTLIPFFNGVYDGKDHSFTPWNAPEYEEKYGSITFTNKIDTRYNEGAQCPAYFDPIAFINSLFDDTPRGRASARIVIQMIQFALRRWNGEEGWLVFLNNVLERAAGHNGKSTLEQLIAFLIEHNSVEAYGQRTDARDYPGNGRKVIVAPIDLWGKDFMLADDIRGAWLLLSDEISGANFIDKTGFLKNLARRQANLYNNKHEKPFPYVFPGVAIHAQNEYVILATKDDASFTHRIDLTFDRDFTNGNKKIKNEYIVDEAVAEYLVRVLCDMEFVDDYDPADLAEISGNTEDVRRANIPAFRFFDEVLQDGFDLPILPAKVLYALYLNWCTFEGLAPLTLQKFQADLVSWIGQHSEDYDVISRPAYLTVEQLNIACSNTQPALKAYGRNKDGKITEYAATKQGLYGYEITGLFRGDALIGTQFRKFVAFKHYGAQSAAAPAEDTAAAPAPAPVADTAARGDQPWRCPRCGAEVRAKDRYCGECGCERKEIA